MIDDLERWLTLEFKEKVAFEIMQANERAWELRLNDCYVKQEVIEKVIEEISRPRCFFCGRKADVIDGLIRCVRCGDGAASWKAHIRKVVEGR